MNINMRRVMKAPTLRMMEGGEMPSAGAQMYGRASANLASMVDTSLGMSGAKPMSAPGAAPAGPQPTSRHDGMFSNPLAMPSMPTVGMKDGGEVSPWSLKGMYRAATGPKETMTEKYARQDAARQPAPALPETTKNISGYASNSALEGRMKAAGLKNGGDLRTGMGGHVPGSGSGDKIDAKYEPGEFVVSNDMLEKAPGLRDMLHGLRSEALADKGMTPEQADAKAVGGGGLRAQNGGLYPYNRPEVDIYAGLGKPASAPENQPGPGGILGSRQTQGAQNGQTQTTVAGAGPASAGGATGGWRNSAPAPGVPGSQGRPSGAVSRPEDEFMPGTKAVFNEGGKDIAAALGQGKYTKAAFTGLRQLATYPVALADDVVGGAVRGAYGMLRNPVEDAGRAMLGMEDRKEPASVLRTPSTVAAPAQTAAPAPTGLNAKAYSLRQGTLGENDNAYHGDLTNKINAAMKSGQTDLASTGMRANDIYKTTSANGTTSYSGYGDGSGKLGNLVSGDGTELRGRGSVSSVPGMSKELIAQTLRNPDGSAWSAADNARMAANLRDGADPYAGTSRMAEEAAPKRGEPGYNRYQATKTARDQNETARRGQDMEREGRLATAAGASASAARAQANDDRKYELDVARLGVDQANKKQADKRAGEKAFDDRVLGMVGVDKEGKPDMGAASAARNTMSAFLAERQAAAQADLKKNPNDKQAAGVLKDIEDNGLAGVDEETLRKVLLDQKAKSVANKGAGWSSWGGTAANSDKPLNSLEFQDSWLPFADKYKGDNGLVLTDDDFEANPDFMQFLGAKAK